MQRLKASSLADFGWLLLSDPPLICSASHAFGFQLFDVFLGAALKCIVGLDRRRRLPLPVEAGIEAGGKELFSLIGGRGRF